MTETAGEKLTRLGTNAQLWAQEFMSHVEAGVTVDEGLMLSYFASAIETGRTAGQSQPVIDDILTQMIQRQRDLQERLGYHFEMMSLRERISFTRDMYVAAMQELGEALDETSWKPWATGEFIHTFALIGELSDTWQFLTNMWFAAFPEASADQLAEMMNTTHSAKVDVNVRRLENGYDGTEKCPQCRRALDDPAVECSAGPLGYHCAQTGHTYWYDTPS